MRRNNGFYAEEYTLPLVRYVLAVLAALTGGIGLLLLVLMLFVLIGRVT